MSGRSPRISHSGSSSSIHKSDSNPSMNEKSRVSSKNAKQTQNILRSKNAPKVQFGVCFDVDGVLARGTIPLQAAQTGIKLLQDDKGEMRVPVVYVTNALNLNQDKANQISSWLGIPVSTRQMIQAPGPLEVFTEFHEKHCLLVGQGKIFEIAKELGFKHMYTVQDVAEAYPLLDMVDHTNRKRVAAKHYSDNEEFPRIEAIMFMGEPKRWESALQVCVDLLRSDGKPNETPDTPPEEHLPIIACNMDLQFQDRACMPRYGHGAFLLCLEALWRKITGRDLKYTALVGKPSETTFRYAEHLLTIEAQRLGIENSLKHMYLVGDTPDSDIVGCNLYQRYIKRLQERRAKSEESGDVDTGKEKEWDLEQDPELPESRNVPRGTNFEKQTVDECHGILVCTGVYKAGVEPELIGDEKNYHGHRDFPHNPALHRPTMLRDNVHEALEAILEREGVSFK